MMKQYKIILYWTTNNEPVQITYDDTIKKISLSYHKTLLYDCGFINLDIVNRTIHGDDNCIIQFHLNYVSYSDLPAVINFKEVLDT